MARPNDWQRHIEVRHWTEAEVVKFSARLHCIVTYTVEKGMLRETCFDIGEHLKREMVERLAHQIFGPLTDALRHELVEMVGKIDSYSQVRPHVDAMLDILNDITSTVIEEESNG